MVRTQAPHPLLVLSVEVPGRDTASGVGSQDRNDGVALTIVIVVLEFEGGARVDNFVRDIDRLDRPSVAVLHVPAVGIDPDDETLGEHPTVPHAIDERRIELLGLFFDDGLLVDRHHCKRRRYRYNKKGDE